MRLSLTPARDQSDGPQTRIFHLQYGDIRPHEKRILALLKADESTHIDDLVIG